MGPLSNLYTLFSAWKLVGDERLLFSNPPKRSSSPLLLPFLFLPLLSLPPSLLPRVPRWCRFMALTDLVTEASHPGFAVDESTETKVTEMVLKLMEDTNGEVKNAGVKA